MSAKYQSGFYTDDEGRPFHVHGKNMSEETMDALKALVKAAHDEFPDLIIGKVYQSLAGCPVRLLRLHNEHQDGKLMCFADVVYVDEINNYGYGKGATGLFRARELSEWDGQDYPDETQSL